MATPAVRVAAPDRDGPQRRLDQVVAAGAVGALAVISDDRGGWQGTSGVAERGRCDRVAAMDGEVFGSWCGDRAELSVFGGLRASGPLWAVRTC
jgi:hypothetical protein